MLTFFAHSSSQDNDIDVRSGWNDPPLSENGLHQAAELRDLVAHLEFDRVYTSDLERSIQTAKIAFPGADSEADFRLRELNYGELNGYPVASFGSDDSRYIANRFPGGECCLDVQHRVQDFLDDCYESGNRIAVVAHRFTQLAFEVIFDGYDWYTVLEFDWRHSGSWRPGWNYDA